MKAGIKNLMLVIMLSFVAWMTPQKVHAQVVVTYQAFYDDLSPYGSWINYPGYGYVWLPSVGSGFEPYASSGHWVYTEYGWTWVSDYAWGWAPFHYGRWEADPVYGWMWIPDNVWGPAWVTWRSAPGYYGWVPLGYKRSNDRNDEWIFVPDKDMDRPDVDRYYVNSSNNPDIRKNSTTINNSGPDKSDVQKKTGGQINQVTVQNSNQPGQSVNNGHMNIYKPKVQASNGSGTQPAPKVVKPTSTGTGDQQPAQNTQQQNNGGQGQQQSTPANNNNQSQQKKPAANNKPKFLHKKQKSGN